MSRGLSFVMDPVWWVFKRSGCARYLLKKLYAEVLYDIELASIDPDGVKAKWVARLGRMENS